MPVRPKPDDLGAAGEPDLVDAADGVAPRDAAEQPRTWTKVRSDIAVAKRRNPNADTTELQRELKAERAADYIRKALDAAPALSVEQLDRLALLLRGGDAA